MAGLDGSQLLEWALLLIATGALAGFLAGLFGIGGGAVLVPVFYECFRLAGVPLAALLPLCIGTSLAVIIPTSSVVARPSCLRRWTWRHPAVGPDGADRRGITASSHALRRSGCSRSCSSWCLAAAVRLLFGRNPAGDDCRRVHDAGLWLCHRALSTLMGVGGGLFSNLLMTFHGRTIHQSVGTSSALAVLISIPGTIGYVYAGWPAAARFPNVTALQLPFAIGYVSPIGAVLVMPTGLLFAPLGVKAAHAMSKRTLEVAFGCYLLIVGSRFVASLLYGV